MGNKDVPEAHLDTDELEPITRELPSPQRRERGDTPFGEWYFGPKPEGYTEGNFNFNNSLTGLFELKTGDYAEYLVNKPRDFRDISEIDHAMALFTSTDDMFGIPPFSSERLRVILNLNRSQIEGVFRMVKRRQEEKESALTEKELAIMQTMIQAYNDADDKEWAVFSMIELVNDEGYQIALSDDADKRQMVGMVHVVNLDPRFALWTEDQNGIVIWRKDKDTIVCLELHNGATSFAESVHGVPPLKI